MAQLTLKATKAAVMAILLVQLAGGRRDRRPRLRRRRRDDPTPLRPPDEVAPNIPPPRDTGAAVSLPVGSPARYDPHDPFVRGPWSVVRGRGLTSLIRERQRTRKEA